MAISGKLIGFDLFSGIGGLTIALQGWVRPAAYCENEPHVQAVLLSRMLSGSLPLAPIWNDIRTLQGKDLPKIDIVYGGFPCQDLSVAGKGKGLAGKRSGLFFEIVRLAKETRSKFIFLENVMGIRKKALHTVGWEPARIGYDCRWGVVSAYDVGASHKRDRWFLLAYATSGKNIGRERSNMEKKKGGGESRDTASRPGREDVADSKSGGRERRRSNEVGKEREMADGIEGGGKHSRKEVVADSNSKGLQGQRTKLELRKGKGKTQTSGGSWWTTEPNVGRVAYEISSRVDRIKSLGNAVVPAQAAEAFKRLMGIIK